MKKLLTLAALVGVATLSYGQGFVSCATGTRTLVVTDGATSTAGATVWNGTPGSWYYEVLVAPTSVTTINQSLTGWAPVGLANNTSRAGSVLGYGGGSDTIGLLVPGYSGTATANFALVGWSANLGTDFSAVMAGAPANMVSGVGAYGNATWANGSVTSITPAGQGAGAWFGISPIAMNILLAPSGGPYNNIVTATAMPGQMAMNYYNTTPTPEPTSLALLGLGAAGMLIFRRRK